MISDLKPYPAMKPSGVPWLGEVPEHWSLTPNRAVMRRRKVLVGNGHTEYQLLSLTKQGIIVRDVESGKGKFSVDMGTCQEVRIGDLVFCLFDVPETPRTVGLSRHDGMITGAYTVFECSDPVLAAFLDSFYRAMDDRKLLSPLYSGLRNTIPPTRFLGAKTPIPPPAEQAAIVRFLQYADTKLRRYIRAKQRLIELLDEQMRLIVLRAVTQGDAAGDRFKASGVQWIGDIPNHWEVRRLKSLCIVKRGASPRPIEDPTYFDDGGEYAWVRIADVSASDRYLERTTQRLSALGKSLSVPLEPGSLFLSIAGSVGKPIITRIKCCIHDGFVHVPRYKGNVEYLYYVLSSGAPYGGLGKLGTQLNLNTETVGSIRIPYPPLEVQARIVASLDAQLAKTSGATRRAREEIALLREYRTRLEADVVMGRLDVREAAAGLPEDSAEPEALADVGDLSDEELLEGPALGDGEAAEVFV